MVCSGAGAGAKAGLVATRIRQRSRVVMAAYSARAVPRPAGAVFAELAAASGTAR
jgi:hypothetical protein